MGRRVATLREALASAILLLNIVTAPASNAADRSSSGIYVTASNYQNGILTAEGRCDSKGHELELHDVLNKTYIHVTHGSATRRYEKTEIFGFRSCKGLDYRFVDNHEYQILEAKGLYIYLIKVRMPNAPGARAMWLKSEYHFSVGSEGPVRLLTLDNLKHAFPDNRRFHDSLEQTFGSGRRLAQYDDLHRMFRVNWLLVASSER